MSIGVAPTTTFEIDMPMGACTPAPLAELRRILHKHEGYVPVVVWFRTSHTRIPLELPSRLAVDATEELMEELVDDLGFLSWLRLNDAVQEL